MRKLIVGLALAAVAGAGCTDMTGASTADPTTGWWCNGHRKDVMVTGSTPLGITEPHWGSIQGTWTDFIDEPCSQDDLDTWCDERPGADYCS